MLERGRLLISCPDQPGLVARVSQFLFEFGANLVHSDQHTTAPHAGRFFMRVEFDLERLAERRAELTRAFGERVGTPLGMDWRVEEAARVKRVALFFSKQDHALLELLWQWKAGDLKATFPFAISNHPDLKSTVEAYGIPFHLIPVTKETKPQAEAQAVALLQGQVDLVVLARYMQIVSGDFIRGVGTRIINIHHSFLPAFIGANPYAAAHARGVKLIGATAHYVTEDLDAGPIIEQDVHRVRHSDDVPDLVRIGRQVERMVFARAVKWHLEDRVLVHGNKTVVFA